MRFFLVLGMLLWANAESIFAQPYGNEWINYNQQYFKIKTAQDGIFRVSYADLQSVGFPVDNVDPRRIQLFHRGNEIAIHFEGQLDARFDPSDYLEFYGRKNDGTLDESLYITPEAQPHKYYNIYSDTSAYFLTWSLTGSNGKRIQNFKENNVSALPAENYHFDEKLTVLTDRYSLGLHYPIGQPSAENFITAFDYGEGWTGPAIRKGESSDFLISGLSDYNNFGSDVPELDMVLIGANNLQHKADIYVGSGTSNLRLLTSATFDYYYSFRLQEALEWSDISASGELIIRVNVTGVNTSPDFVSVSYVKLSYPENFEQNSQLSKYYTLSENSSNKSYVEITNVPASSRIFDITDPTNLVQIGYNQVSSSINAIIPNTSVSRKLLVTNEYYTNPAIEKVNFRNFNPSQSEFVIITHPKLRTPTGSYQDVIQAYASYRASSQGGNYDTLTFNIGQLFNQFNYGETSSMAIYNFARYLNEQGNSKYLLIIGKGLTPNYNSHRSDVNSQEYPDLVPTGGYPGNDMIFSAGIRTTDNYPEIPTGRLSVTNPSEAAAYLEKVKEMESLEFDDLWRKELIHLSGGRGTAQQNLFKAFVNGFEQTATNVYLGGEVTTQSKKTNNETELINISDLVNEGKSLITFFGHSGSNLTDIEIGYVTNDALGYNNKGKYTSLLVNGCNAGDAYFPGIGFGVDWINAEERGAIAFIAHSGVGNSSTLRRYTNIFYEVGYGDSTFIEKGIGEIQKEVAIRYLDRYIKDPTNIAQAQQMALQGDPAVKLFGATLPDYSIESQDVFAESTDGQPINVFSESFNLGIAVKNFGKALLDSLDVFVTRELSNGTTIQLDTATYKATYYQDTLRIEVASAGIESFGINTFTIALDPKNKLEELNELNNTVSFEYFIPLGGTINRYPSPFQIIDSSRITLISQSLDLLMDERQFLFEIDTTDQFNSPILQSTGTNAKVIAKWDIDLNSIFSISDTTVFYWRTKFASPREGELDEWTTTSFTFIQNGDEGWDMSHFPQFSNTKKDLVVDNQDLRKWEFEQFTTNLFVRTYGADHPDLDFNNVELKINDAALIYPGQVCTNNSVNMLGFSSSTTAPYKILPFSAIDVLDRRTCGRVPQVINNFINNELTPPQEYILAGIDAVPTGDFVLMFSIGNVEYATIPSTSLDAMESIGATISDITGLSAGQPFILLGRKGMEPGEAIFITSDQSSVSPIAEQEISMDEVIIGTITSGTIETPVIGPASSWNQLFFQYRSLDVPNTDVNSIEIIGLDESNDENILFSNVTSSPVDISSIDPQAYTQIKLRFQTSDETNLTPGQLESWLVTYEGVPDGILTYNDDPDSKIEVQEGEDIQSSFSFENISKKDFTDSLIVSYTYSNKTSNQNFTDSVTISPLKKWEKTDFDIQTKTLDKVGEGSLRVFANPYLQSEKTYNNNVINLEDYAEVLSDQSNPILEVTFDGSFIMDGDIVSPSPQILVRLKDDNTTLKKTDTLGMELRLKRPCEGCNFERISFSNPNVIWTPATEDEEFNVEFNPQNLEDGIYALSVQAADESGNQSGSEPYAVTFEVINESTITNFFPYPNPFSTNTRFVFTLTGSEPPDDLIIQIMTVSGIVVREITMDEIGPIKIGNNMSDFAWNGKDEFGDQLANGVYLYRVKVFKDGEPMKLRATSADRAFKHGVGKIYLLR